MKIIFDDETEKQNFLDLCEYLHDYTVDIEGVSKKTKITVWSKFGTSKKRVVPRKGCRWVALSLNLNNNSMLNFIAHLPSASEDIQDKYLTIKQ